LDYYPIVIKCLFSIKIKYIIKMEYRRLGATGLKVSAVSYGNWVNADDNASLDANTKVIQKAWELGINYFDTAEGYGKGRAET
jgi:aryl-alcohol dehydrogenase-like predicted oxidoreductase